MLLSQRLKKMLLLRGMSQRKFAKAVGRTEASVSRYLSGERIPNISTAVKMAETLNVSLDWLCGVDKKDDTDLALYQQGWSDAVDALRQIVTRKDSDE